MNGGYYYGQGGLDAGETEGRARYLYRRRSQSSTHSQNSLDGSDGTTMTGRATRSTGSSFSRPSMQDLTNRGSISSSDSIRRRSPPLPGTPQSGSLPILHEKEDVIPSLPPPTLRSPLFSADAMVLLCPHLIDAIAGSLPPVGRSETSDLIDDVCSTQWYRTHGNGPRPKLRRQ